VLLLLLLVLLEGALRFLQPTKARTNEVGTLESRCQNFSLSPILFLSSSCQVKKNKKQKRCSAALVGVVALSDITATFRGLARYRTSQQHAARSSALSAIAATPRGPARCWPSQQRCDVQQRRKNAASCSALTANAATTLRAATLPAIVAALRGAAV